MKYLKIIAFSIIFLALYTNLSAQTVKNNSSTKTITASEMPKNVVNTLKLYPDYKVSNQVAYTKTKSHGKVYRVKVTRKGIDNIFVINRKGKIVAIEDGESNQPNR